MDTNVSKIFAFSLAALLVVSSSLSVAEAITKKEVDLMREIRVIKSIVKDNSVKVYSLDNEINHLNYKLYGASRILKIINSHEKISNQELTKLQDQLSVLNIQKEEALIDLQALLLEEYKHRDYKKKLYFLASSKNIAELVNRVTQLNSLKDYRLKQLRAIDNKRREVEDKLAVYQGTKEQKRYISQRKSEYISELNETLRAKHQLQQNLEQENQTLSLRIREKNKELEELNTVVREVLQPKTEDKSLIKRKFVWPVESGLIVERFGVHKHSRERKVKVTNNGIDVLVTKNQEVVASQDGKVKAVVELPGQNKSVIIEHNGFYSVYSNLQNVELTIGDIIVQGERVGNVAQNKNRISKFHFELWQGINKVDPEKYLEGSLD